MREFHETLLRILAEGGAVATAVIVRTSGSTPRGVGARMIVPAEAEPLFTLGGGAFEAEVIRDAREAVARREPLLKTYSLADRGSDGAGQECGGSATVFIEPHGAQEKLWIYGGGHVGRALAAASRGLGFEVTVFEDRAGHAEAAKIPGATAVVRTDEGYRERVPAPGTDTYCVVLTRSHRTDRNALRAALGGSARWVGMIGSARKRLAVFKELREEDGIAEARLAEVETPVGIPIGAETPEEIAISILARIVQLRRAAPRGPS
jgi:xanthine dehydrogenase accessory factor